MKFSRKRNVRTRNITTEEPRGFSLQSLQTRLRSLRLTLSHYVTLAERRTFVLRGLVVFIVAAGVFLVGARFSLMQAQGTDHPIFKHSSERHAALACTDCHQRPANNSATPVFPGHAACTGCHTPLAPRCSICHVDLQTNPPPLKKFPTNFLESFNVKFDHKQHLTRSARPKNGCAACHSGLISRGAGLSIPTGMVAHNQCYACHTPDSKANSGREMASCGVCHDEKAFARTSTNARAFRIGFSHAKHTVAQRLDCTSCHIVTASASQGKQMSSPAGAEHFASGRGQSCGECHNGKRAFGGDLGFKDCKRCHTGSTFRLPG